MYVRMIEGAPVPMPYASRVLVPTVARVLPATPATALHVLTDVSLAIWWLLAFAICRSLRVSSLASSIALIAVALSPPLLYQHHNPYLTDGAALAVLAGLILAVLRRRWHAALALFVVLVLVRGLPISDVPHSPPTLQRWLWLTAVSWHLLWIAAFVGFLAAHDHVRAITVGVFAPAIVLSLLTSDTVRMWLWFAPAVVILTALSADSYNRDRGRRARAVFDRIVTRGRIPVHVVTISGSPHRRKHRFWIADFDGRAFSTTQRINRSAAGAGLDEYRPNH